MSHRMMVDEIVVQVRECRKFIGSSFLLAQQLYCDKAPS